MSTGTRSTVVHSPSLWMKFSWSLAKQALALPVSPGLALRVEVPVHEEGLVVQGNPGHLLRLHQGRVQQGSLLIANVVPWPEPEKPTIAKVVYIRLGKAQVNINSKKSNLAYNKLDSGLSSWPTTPPPSAQAGCPPPSWPLP